MLLLTRRVGETLWIGDDIKITVFRTKGDSVQVGIEAPADVTILREELRGGAPSREPKRPKAHRQAR